LRPVKHDRESGREGRKKERERERERERNGGERETMMVEGENSMGHLRRWCWLI
jgi:hypothetical protein